jgi:hypothetical protein
MRVMYDAGQGRFFATHEGESLAAIFGEKC